MKITDKPFSHAQWVLTEEDVLEPARLLKAAMARKDLPETGVFDVCDIGESRLF